MFTTYAAGRRKSPISWRRIKVLSNVSDIVHCLLVCTYHKGFASVVSSGGRRGGEGSDLWNFVERINKRRSSVFKMLFKPTVIQYLQNVIQAYYNTLSSECYSSSLQYSTVKNVQRWLKKWIVWPKKYVYPFYFKDVWGNSKGWKGASSCRITECS
jgi:hypothetical protein